MNATAELNAPHARNDVLTTSAVLRYIVLHYPDTFGEVHLFAAVNEALRANDAMEGCRAADRIAVTLERVRAKMAKLHERFADERNLRDTL